MSSSVTSSTPTLSVYKYCTRVRMAVVVASRGILRASVDPVPRSPNIFPNSADRGERMNLWQGISWPVEATRDMDFLPGFSLEGYPNRDSTIYSELYGINEASTILRGTLRYKGYVDAIKGLVKLGLLDPNPAPVLHENGPALTWK